MRNRRCGNPQPPCVIYIHIDADAQARHQILGTPAFCKPPPIRSLRATFIQARRGGRLGVVVCPFSVRGLPHHAPRPPSAGASCALLVLNDQSSAPHNHVGLSRAVTLVGVLVGLMARLFPTL